MLERIYSIQQKSMVELQKVLTRETVESPFLEIFNKHGTKEHVTQ